MVQPNPSIVQCREPVLFFALGFGAGCLRPAPGTWGTLAAVPLVIAAQQVLSGPQYLALTAGLGVLGVWLCAAAARRLGVDDHPAIVWDEIVGYFVAMSVVPAGWLSLLIGFVLFRGFDIIKPWPIRWLDRHIHGGLGIMLDDIVAGIGAAIGLYAMDYFKIL